MSENKKLLVVIDPGHTGNTYNAGAVKGYYESKAVYDLSLYEKAALEKRWIDVILTRERNQDPGLMVFMIIPRNVFSCRNRKT